MFPLFQYHFSYPPLLLLIAKIEGGIYNTATNFTAHMCSLNISWALPKNVYYKCILYYNLVINFNPSIT